ncbi:MAG: dihydrodipicolinate synthase family protein [Oscillospiraceae bacterium]
MERIKGVIPPVITPFKENGDVDYDGFASNMQKWNKDDLYGYLIAGSNGEPVFLSEQEKSQLVKIAVDNALPGRLIIVGSCLDSVRETIRTANEYAAMGAGAVLVATPFYYSGSMDSRALIKFFTEVADNTDLPVMLYNVSKYTHVNITADALVELSRHKNIVGMKDSNGDVPQLANFLRAADPKFQIMTGTFASWYPALTMGITGIISAMANCCPEAIVKVQQLYDAGKSQEAFKLYQRWLPVNTAVTGTFGIAGLKYACDCMGYHGGFVRNPLSDCSREDKKKIDSILDDALNQ